MFIGKFVMGMLNTEVFLIAQIDKSVISAPTIRVNDAFQVYPATYNPLESSTGVVRNDFCIDFVIAFEQPKNNGFSSCATTTYTSNAASPKVAFINFNFSFDGRLCLAITGDSFPESGHISVDGISVNSRQFRNL